MHACPASAAIATSCCFSSATSWCPSTAPCSTPRSSTGGCSIARQRHHAALSRVKELLPEASLLEILTATTSVRGRPHADDGKPRPGKFSHVYGLEGMYFSCLKCTAGSVCVMRSCVVFPPTCTGNSVPAVDGNVDKVGFGCRERPGSSQADEIEADGGCRRDAGLRAPWS